MIGIRRVGIFFVLLVVSVDSSGCTSGAPDVGSDPVTTPTSLTEPAEPFDAYLASREQNDAINKGLRVLTRRCMERYGFEGEQGGSLLGLAEAEELEGRGFLDENLAARYGYFPPAPKPTNTPPSQQDRDRKPGSFDVFIGKKKTYEGKRVPAGGCLGEAERQLGRGAPAFEGSAEKAGLPVSAGSLEQYQSYVSRLRAQAGQQAISDERFRTAERKWSACMKRAGYTYKRWLDGRYDKRWQDREDEGKPPSEIEIKTAVADVRCRKETNLVGIRAAVEAKYQKVQIEKHSQLLGLAKENLQTYLRNAADLLDRRD